MAKKAKKVEEEVFIEEEPTPEPELEPKIESNKVIKEIMGVGYKNVVYEDGTVEKIYD